MSSTKNIKQLKDLSSDALRLVESELDALEQQVYALTSAAQKFKVTINDAKTGKEIYEGLKLFIDNLVITQSILDRTDDNATLVAQALDPVMRELDNENNVKVK